MFMISFRKFYAHAAIYVPLSSPSFTKCGLRDALRLWLQTATILKKAL